MNETDTDTDNNGYEENSIQVSAGSRPGHLRVSDRYGNSAEFEPDAAEAAAVMLLEAANGGSVLLDAYRTAQKRGRQYGPPGENFEAAAALIGSYLGADMDGFDYAVAMVLAKAARLQTGGRDRDTLLDIAGYARGAAAYEGVNDA